MHAVLAPSSASCASRCGTPLSVRLFSSTLSLETQPFGDGKALATWIEYRDGDRNGEVYCALVSGREQRPVGTPINGLKLPRKQGPVSQVEVARIGQTELAVGIVTERSGESDLSFARVRIADGSADTALKLACDSSIAYASGLRLVKLIPTAEHEFIAVLNDERQGAPTTVIRRVDFESSLNAADSPEYRPIVSPDVFTLGSVADGQGGCILLAQTLAEAGGTRLFHVDPDGRIDPHWPAGGYVLGGQPSATLQPTLVADRTGGAFAIWSRWNEPQDTLRTVAVRVDSMGTLVPGWDPVGTVILPDESGYQTPSTVAVGRNGLLFAAVKEVTRISMIAMDGYGHTARGWPSEGVPLAGGETGVDIDDPILACLASDSCLVSWSMKSQTTSGYDLFAAELPLADGAETLQPGARTPICTAGSD